MSDNNRELLRLGRHEAAHAVASWHFTGQIIAATLGSDLALAGCVWGGYNNATVIGSRQAMVGLAAGAAAEGVEVSGDDALRLVEAARRIVGLRGAPEEIRAEIRRAEVGAHWLCQEYAVEIESTARLLVQFHEHLANMERRYADLA